MLTSVLLITLDLRGNAVFNAARTGFGYALDPLEVAGEVITRPVERAWGGITEIDDLKAENRRLQAQIDSQQSAVVAAQNALIENGELRTQLNLEILRSFDSVSAEVIGLSPSNFDQRVEIARGSLDGLRVGMPVVNAAGLVGKITIVAPQTAIVMLVTDPLYTVPVKVVGVEAAPNVLVPGTVPSGIPVDQVGSTTVPTTTSTTTSTTTTTTVPVVSDDGSVATVPGPTIAPFATTTSTTTIPKIEVTRETGGLDGFGADRLPRVRFISDSPQFGRILVGDAVLTAGGSTSLAPPNIPIGVVKNVIDNPGALGLELEVELNADLDRLNFLTVILYQPPTEFVEQ